VKGSNSDGIWNETEATFSFVINPPWWRTYWAYLGYILLITGLLYIIRHYEMHRVRLRHQLTLQTLETRKFQELEKMKSRFFTNLSHEFRTPLMLITGPIEQLQSGSYKGNLQKMYGVISRNSRRLLDLVDQSLALSQLEAGVLPLRAREENLTPFLRGLVYSFDSLAEKKGIQLVFETDCDFCPVWIDHDKFEKIITNLLSNAMKFTPAGGRVNVICRVNPSEEITIESESGDLKKNDLEIRNSKFKTIKVIISDTGIGIPPEQQKKIFERFYQVDDASLLSFGGSGIGLALVKELVDLHHWTISLHSEVGKGSTFILQIPQGHTHLKDEEIVPEAKLPARPISAEIGRPKVKSNYAQERKQEKELGPAEGILQSTVQRSPLPKILIVEDSVDVRYYLSTILVGAYELYEAASGEEGLQKAASLVPDLIISDIMMPAMDGMEFCRRIKSDLATSHIPMILLTARASQESRLEGLETGADDYLVKPFERRELLLRVKNLIDQRRRMRDKFKLDLLVEPSAVTATSMDEDFLKKAIGVVEKNLTDPNFETENFAGELYLSRSQLHRKLTGLTGQTPGEFIRTIRLKRAAQLLQKRGVNVSEVAYEVGFNNLSYFAKAFRRQFNCSPSEYLEKSG
jgi:signal transduction histidine kinase/DNA-binding response OmpR family regulator